MKKLIRLQGSAVPLMRANVDTDVIIRIERLSTISRPDLGPYAFESLRYRPDGSEDPSCPFNLPRFRDAPILLGGPNFGCGSSREGAVWALEGLGIRCVIAESFGDIFFNNCLQNGMLPIRLSQGDMNALVSHTRQGAPIVVDLQSQQIERAQHAPIAFTIDPMKRTALLEGLDDIDQTLRKKATIETWQARNQREKPWIWNTRA
jgi:3-isopropylmalate/(R)-2-methylmalate dehydratase small subunit